MAAAMSASARDLATLHMCSSWGIATVALLSFALACVLQAAFIYWKRYPRDRLLNKVFVAYLCFCCVTHCSLIVAEVATTMEILLDSSIDSTRPLEGQLMIPAALVWLYVPDRLFLWLVAVPVETFYALRAIRMYSSKTLYYATITVCALGSAMFLAIEIYRMVIMATTGAPFSHKLAIMECASLWANAVFHGAIITVLLRQVLASRAAAEPKARLHHVKGIWSAALLETSAVLAILNLGMPISASFINHTQVLPAKILFFGAYTPVGSYCVIFTLNSRRALAERVDRRVRLADVRGTRDDPSTWKGDVSMVYEDRLIINPRQSSRNAGTRSVTLGLSGGAVGGGAEFDGGLIAEGPKESDMDEDVFDPDEIVLDASVLETVKPASLLPSSPRSPLREVSTEFTALAPQSRDMERLDV